MIILDTNVLTALMQVENTERRVERWLSGVAEQSTVTSITRAEILSGIALLPRGNRRTALRDAADRAFASFPEALPFNHSSAAEYAAVLEIRGAAGRPISVRDTMIAAIARQTGAGLATRNTKDFDDLGLRLIDPWSEKLGGARLSDRPTPKNRRTTAEVDELLREMREDRW